MELPSGPKGRRAEPCSCHASIKNGKEIHSFNAQLYKSEMESDINQDNLKDFEDLTNELFIPRLSNPERDAIEGKLTIEECKEALNTFNSVNRLAKTVSPLNFTTLFFALLGKDLTNCLNESYDLGEMSISQHPCPIHPTCNGSSKGLTTRHGLPDRQYCTIRHGLLQPVLRKVDPSTGSHFARQLNGSGFYHRK